MIEIQTLIEFTSAAFILALIPGPDNIFVLMQSLTQGKKAGIFVVFGLCSGLVFHTLAVALGVAAIFKTSQLAFSVLKYVGCAYLLYLAYKSYKSSSQGISEEKAPALPLKNLYFRGVVMNITNPKVSIFFLAFLPQFCDPAKGSVFAQVTLLGIVFMITTLIVFGAVAFLSGAIGSRLLKSPKAQNYLNKLASLVFVGLAFRLAIAKR
jgi:threonine/homoserine/homoserine lactone efflux protein